MNEMILQDLRDAVEKALGRHLKVRTDFDLLVDKIEERSSERLSSTTIRRFWGYQADQDAHVSMTSLNILSRFIGFDDFSAFCDFRSKHCEEDGDQSYFTQAQRIYLDDVEPGLHIRQGRRIMRYSLMPSTSSLNLISHPHAFLLLASPTIFLFVFRSSMAIFDMKQMYNSLISHHLFRNRNK